MKKIYLLIIFMFTASAVFSQGIYFNPPTSNSVFYSDSSGYIAIPYHMYAIPSYVVDVWKAKLIYPNNNETNWQLGQTGGWYVTEAGIYQIKGMAHVYDFIIGGSWKWVKRDPFSFQCADTIAPRVPKGLVLTSQDNHPKISWTPNIEADTSYYEIYKKKNSTSYSYFDQTSNNYYVDLSELLYTGGGNKTYIYYKIKAVDVNANKSGFSASTRAAVNGILQKNAHGNGINSDNIFKLFENYPNPFNPSTTISYQIPKGSYITIKLYNTLGKEVAELVNEFEEPGKYSVIFNADNLPSGLYFYRLQAGSFSDVKKMLLTK